MAKEKPSIEEKDELQQKSHLIAYDLLKSTAGWLESPENEVFSLLEYDNDSLDIAVKASVIAAAVLKKAALDMQIASGIEDTNKYEKNIVDQMAELKALADELDESGDEKLMKKASLLDEILVTMASGVEEKEALEKKFETKIAEIKSRKHNALDRKVATEDKKESKKELRPLEAPLSTRYCPDHPGAGLTKVRDDVYCCSLCSKQFDYRNGYTTAKGNKVPGTSADRQTADLANVNIHTMFQDKNK